MTKNTLFKLMPISLAVTLALNAGIAVAQEEGATNEEVEVIKVGGIRGSIMKSMNSKRFSADIIDTVSAEDIGKFPDSNIAESLQRITGVSIDRDGGEGRSITIRGMGPTFNMTTFNGRMVASDSPTRSFSYDTLGASMISGVEVFKTQNASLLEGGIGGLVNIKTARPFDHDGRRVVVNAQAEHNMNGGKTTPRLDFSYSDRFNDGNTGLLVAVNFHESEREIHKVGNFQWVPSNQDVPPGTPPNVVSEFGGQTNLNGLGWLGYPDRIKLDDAAKADYGVANFYRPQSLDRGVNIENREKKTLNTTFQHNFSEDITLTVDGLYSEFDVMGNATTTGNWFWKPSTYYDPAIDARQATDPILPHIIDSRGTLTRMAHGANGFATNRARNVRDSDLALVGANLEWQLTEDLSFVGDVFYSEANDKNPGRNRQITLETESGDSWVGYDNTDGEIVPKLMNVDDHEIVPEEYYIAQVQQFGQDITAKNIGVKLDFDQVLDLEILPDFYATNIQFGAHFANNRKDNVDYKEDGQFQDLYKHRDHFNNLRLNDPLDDLPEEAEDNPAQASWNRVTLAETLTESQSMEDFVAPGVVGLSFDGVNDDVLLLTNPEAYLEHITSKEAINYLQAAQDGPSMARFLVKEGARDSEGNVYTLNDDGTLPTDKIEDDALYELFMSKGGFDPHKTVDSFEVEEKTTSLYANLNFEAELASMMLTGMVGLRYVQTDITSSGSIRNLAEARFAFGDPTAEPQIADSGSLIFDDENPSFEEHTSSYDNLLPNLNLNLNITDEVIARFGWTKTMTRPQMEDIAPYTDYGQENLNGALVDVNENGNVDPEDIEGMNTTAQKGNPYLKPYVATNLDVSLEWYYSDDSAITLAYYDKKIEDWITNAVTPDRVDIGPNFPNQLRIFYDTPVNIDTTDVDGIELNWQHTLDWGLGWQANYSTVNSNAVLGLDSNFSLEGLSDTRNLVVFYENSGFQVRVAYNWRDGFLQDIQDQSSTIGNPEPQYVAAYEQYDVSASYKINQYFTVQLQGINVTNEKTHKHGRYENHFMEYTDTGARYRLGVRGNF